MATKINVWKEFRNWLFDNNINSILDNEVHKKISIIAALCMFGGLHDLTIELNKLFNNFYVLSDIDKYRFFLFLKKTIQEKKILSNELIYLDNTRKNKTFKCRSRLPNLKNYEIEYLLKHAKKDEQFESFLHTIGEESDLKIKKKRKPKKESTKK